MQENAGFIISTKMIQIKKHAPRHEKSKPWKGPKSYITKDKLKRIKRGLGEGSLNIGISRSIRRGISTTGSSTSREGFLCAFHKHLSVRSEPTRCLRDGMNQRVTQMSGSPQITFYHGGTKVGTLLICRNGISECNRGFSHFPLQPVPLQSSLLGLTKSGVSLYISS